MSNLAETKRHDDSDSQDPLLCDDITMLAHDVRGFLHAIKTSIYVLRTSRPGDDQLQEMLDIIDRDHEHVLPRLNRLIEMARTAEAQSRAKENSREGLAPHKDALAPNGTPESSGRSAPARAGGFDGSQVVH